MPELEDLRTALLFMGNYKSFDPNRMKITFFKHYWEIVGEAVVKEILLFFEIGRLKYCFNNRFIPLILKVRGAAKVANFQPIALCNIIFKVTTKIFARRIRSLLLNIIHLNQAAFIPHR